MIAENVPDHNVIKFINCRLAIGDSLVPGELWFSGTTGRIIEQQIAFYDNHIKPNEIYDLGGRILAPGFIDVQLNGAYGFDFSVPAQNYREAFETANKQLIKTGVTSYLPTLTSQLPHVYHKNLPYLAARTTRSARDGSESLGAHCEGPFMNSKRNGIHKLEVLQLPGSDLSKMEACYGVDNLNSLDRTVIKMITMAPELDETGTVVGELASRNIIVSAGHSDADYEQMCDAVQKGVTMVTHLFNAMAQPHHRNPGIFGILGARDGFQRPYFGIIADNIHVHSTFVRAAYTAHPDGIILVTDAMSMLGLPDGTYNWTNGEMIEKRGGMLTLKGTDRIAGSCVKMIECLNNFINWTGAPIASAIRSVTSTPAKMLGLNHVKGTIMPGADADFVILNESEDKNGKIILVVDEVWKFGARVAGGAVAKL